jgi:basic membrane protein A
MTSMLKRVDTAVFDFVKSFKDGSPLAGVQVFDLSKDGVGYATSNSAALSADITKAMDDAKAAIVAGTIKVPSVPTK